MITLHFRAENFEATATELPKSGAYLSDPIQWVVRSGGIGSHSLQGIGGQDAVNIQVLTSVGWKDLVYVHFANDVEPLALAISLLYSVPGVEVYEPQTADGSPAADRDRSSP